jgi:predicted alpha/beta-hydrolase family hydrolase
MTAPAFLFNGPKKSKLTLAFAHGAGAGMDSDFMTYFAEALGKRSLRVARFEFPYMAQRRTDGKKRPPDRAPVLLETWRAVIEEFGADRTIVGGKSMGGRMASLIAALMETEKSPVRGAVYLGYPFHAPGKPMGSRDLPLGATKTPSLILQGERDPFGPRAELETFKFSRAVTVRYLPDGDHSLVPRKSSGHTQDGNWDAAVEAIVEFVEKL